MLLSMLGISPNLRLSHLSILMMSGGTNKHSFIFLVDALSLGPDLPNMG